VINHEWGKVCLIPWHTPRNWQWGAVKNKTLIFNFPIVNFPYICSNIPAALHIKYLSLSRYSRACGSYQDFLERGLLLTRKLLNQVFLLVKLKSSLRKFYGHHQDLIAMEYLCHKWPRICSTCREHFPVLSSFKQTYLTLWYPLFQAQWDRCDKRNHQT
jgi:hypothetical protein